MTGGHPQAPDLLEGLQRVVLTQHVGQFDSTLVGQTAAAQIQRLQPAIFVQGRGQGSGTKIANRVVKKPRSRVGNLMASAKETTANGHQGFQGTVAGQGLSQRFRAWCPNIVIAQTSRKRSKGFGGRVRRMAKALIPDRPPPTPVTASFCSFSSCRLGLWHPCSRCCCWPVCPKITTKVQSAHTCIRSPRLTAVRGRCG